MRAMQLSLRHSSWLRILVGALIVLSLAFAGPAWSQDELDDEDDFLSDDFGEADDEDDFLSDDFGGADDEDDFLSDDFAETAVEAFVQEKGVYYWTFEVPVDVLLLRPVGAVDVAIGGMFVSVVALPIIVGAGIEAIVEVSVGRGWYFDTNNLDAALEAAVIHPSDFLFNRPLGQLVSF